MDKQSETEDDIDNEENNEEQVNHISEGQNENSQSNCFINKKAYQLVKVKSFLKTVKSAQYFSLILFQTH